MKIVNAAINDLPKGGSYSIATQIRNSVGICMTLARHNAPYSFYPENPEQYQKVIDILDSHNWKYTTQDYQA